MTKKLQLALEAQKQQTKQEVPQIAGVLGIPLNGQKRVEVPGRNSYVFVRLRSNQSEVVQAFNNKVSPAYNLPVLVERDGNRYVVASVDTKRYENNWNSQSAFLPRHGNTHSFDIESGGGGDIVWVYPRQITPILAMPSGSSGAGNVIINPYILRNNDGTWRHVGNTGTANITQYNPTGSNDAIIALIYLDALSGNPYLLINSGTVFSNTITGSSQLVSYIPAITNQATQIPLAAIRLITGTRQISWDNIYDVRQFLHTIPTGSGGGGLSSVPVYNTGTLVGNAASLDFQHPLFVGFSGTTAYPSLDGTLLAVEDVTNQFISGSSVNHFTLTGTIELGTDRLYYNGLRQQRITHYAVDANGKGFSTNFTGTYDDVLIMEYGNLGAQASLLGISGHIIQYNGVLLPSRSKLNFISTGVAVQDDSSNDATKITILDTHYFPFNTFGGYLASADQAMFFGTIDRAVEFVRWSQAFFVYTTNNGSHYWTIEIKNGVSGNVIASFNTSTYSPNTYYRKEVTSFSPTSVQTSEIYLFIYCTKTGTPGNLQIPGTALLVK